MNLKTFAIIIISFSVFLGIYFFSMFSAITLLIGVGIGVLIHKPISEIFTSFQKGIYLSEKENMLHRKLQLEKELEKLKNEGVA
jgi:hypothetical protein